MSDISACTASFEAAHARSEIEAGCLRAAVGQPDHRQEERSAGSIGTQAPGGSKIAAPHL
jgi:hypothetical protein